MSRVASYSEITMGDVGWSLCGGTVSGFAFGIGLETLSLPNSVLFLASDLEPCLVMGTMSEGFRVDVME